MLYLNSIENAEASPTENKYAICHEEVPSMQNIPELAPSRELLAQWQSQEIGWEKFHKQFIEEMRTEYLNGEMSRLRGLVNYSLENDVTLHSPEPSGEQTYRAILEEIINVIWESEGRPDRVNNLVRERVAKSQLIDADLVLQFFAEVIAPKDAEIHSLQAEIHSLQAAIRNRGRENEALQTQIDQLQGEINTYTENIRTKDAEIHSLQAAIRNRGRENEALQTQIDQLQDINTHPRIRDIAVKATEDDSVFGEYFRTLNIDENRPESLLETLRNWLIVRLKTGPNDLRPLPELIQEHFDQAGDRADRDLAHVIRTQRNLIVFKKQEVDERTIMGRALCCFFAAASLCPELPELE